MTFIDRSGQLLLYPARQALPVYTIMYLQCHVHTCIFQQISLKVCEEMCSQIVESVIGELVQEVVAVCIDDIVKRYNM